MGSAAYLIVNADDLGFAADIDAAIEELHRAGYVTNASLMVDGSSVGNAMEVIRRNPRLGVGLHLDICPVLGLYEMPYAQMRANAGTAEMRGKVAAEVDRQITQFKALGIPFTHLDGHRHFHALPEVFATVVDVAAAHGLKTIRLTTDWLLPRTPSVFWDDAFFRNATDLLDRYGIRYPDRFVYGWKNYDETHFGPGWNELMVHVGTASEEYRREYELLGSPEFQRRVEASGVLMKSYRDLYCEQERTNVS
jgi:predicted glycoside hydrolase/deacetylase ChbG (UPF0249 family)